MNTVISTPTSTDTSPAQIETQAHAAQARLRYKEQVQAVRKEVIISAVNHLLASKGYDAMTVDEVALHAGMSKASLYKMYDSKEALAGAAMVQVMDKALTLVDERRALPPPTPAVAHIKAVVCWAMRTKLQGTMPSLPSHDSSLSDALKNNEAYMERLFQLSMKLGVWVNQAQQEGDLRADLPPEAILYYLYARACDPVLSALKANGNYSDEQIIDWLLSMHFHGLLSHNPNA